MNRLFTFTACAFAICSSGLAQPDTLWTRVIGDTNRNYAASLDGTIDGGYVLFLHFVRGTSGVDSLIKLSVDGESEWTRLLDNELGIRSVRALADGRMLMNGHDIFLADFSGTLLDTLHDPTERVNYFSSLDRTPEGIAALGTGEYTYLRNGDEHRVYVHAVVQFDLYSNLASVVELGTEESYFSLFPSAATDFGMDRLAVAGTSGNMDHLFIHVHGSDGWSLFACPSSGCQANVSSVSLAPAEDGGLLCVFGIYGLDWQDTSSVIRLYKYDLHGDSLWGREVAADAHVLALRTAGDGNYLLALNRWVEGRGVLELMKLDPAGQTIWSHVYDWGISYYVHEFTVDTLGQCTFVAELAHCDTCEQILVFKTRSVYTSADEPHSLPAQLVLHPAYPNPFNPSTTISFELARASHVSLSVFDITGREVASLLDETRSAGSYEIAFDGTTLPSGVYLYRLQTGEFSQTRKMLLLK